MCLIIFDWQASKKRLILAANRDEFYARPTQSAHWWQQPKGIFGGRDLEMGGTWLAADQRGRLAAVTNFRRPDASHYPRSRGEIPTRFLAQQQSAPDYAKTLKHREHEYAGFNALLFDGKQLCYVSNRDDQSPRVLASGSYALSNHLLDTPWPKAKKMKTHMQQVLSADLPWEHTEMRLMTGLNDDSRAPDEALPDTGVAIEVEKMLSAVFIHSPNYGTRCSTVVRIEGGVALRFAERSFDERGKEERWIRETIDLSD